jgi:xanthine dehydrogenase YagS FAD-binding subunit
MCVALAALDATVNVIGPAGERSLPFGEVHRLPGNAKLTRISSLVSSSHLSTCPLRPPASPRSIARCAIAPVTLSLLSR